MKTPSPSNLPNQQNPVIRILLNLSIVLLMLLVFAEPVLHRIDSAWFAPLPLECRLPGALLILLGLLFIANANYALLLWTNASRRSSLDKSVLSLWAKNPAYLGGVCVLSGFGLMLCSPTVLGVALVTIPLVHLYLHHTQNNPAAR